jgi:hypothetical protein
MNYGIVLGSNLLIDTQGVLRVFENGKQREFFRIRGLHRIRSEGSYLVLDCDIRDSDGIREVKLFKSKPVASNPRIVVANLDKGVRVSRDDGTTIIQVEEITFDSLPETLTRGIAHWRDEAKRVEPLQAMIKQIDAIEVFLEITGSFKAGSFDIQASRNKLVIGGAQLVGNIQKAGRGISLNKGGGVSF